MEGVKGKVAHHAKGRIFFEAEPHHEIASMKITIFNYINIALGPLVFCVPVVFYYTKLILGVILTVAVAAIFWVSAFFNVTAGRLTGATTLTKLALAYHSWKGYYVMVLLITVQAVLNLIIFNIIMADNLSKILIILNEDWKPPEAVRNWLLIIVNVVVIFGLCRAKQTGLVSKFGIASLALFSINFIIMAVYFLGFNEFYLSIEWEIRHFAVEVALTIPILFTGFSTTHCNFFLNKCLKKNHSVRWNIVTFIRLAISSIVVMFMGFGGLLLFSNFIQGNILNNFCIDDTGMKLVRFLVTLMVILHYPVHFLTLRELFKATLYLDELSGSRLLLVTSVILSMTTGIAVWYSCAETYMILNGIFTGIPLTCLISPYFYIRASKTKKQTWKQVLAMMLIVLGFVLYAYCVLNLYIQLSKSSNETCLYQNHNPYCVRETETVVNVGVDAGGGESGEAAETPS